jgi:TPP-dependent pyruvate/acetoin dehydrogenase alpha subunit
MTYRQCGHSRSDPRTYRSRDEEDEWKQYDPIPRYRNWLVDQGVAVAGELSHVESEVEQTIQDAIAFAEASPEPTPQDVYLGMFKE